MRKLSTIAALAVVLTSGCGAAEAASAPYTYEVWGTGAGTAMVTYLTDANGSQSFDEAATLPWTVDVDMTGATLTVPLALTAIGGEGVGEIHCRVKQGDKVLVENVSTGPYALVVCSNV